MSTITYTEQRIVITTSEGNQTVKAQVASNGLAFHLTSGKFDLFTVTHVASGQAVCKQAKDFSFSGHCRRFIQLISEIADWQSDKPDLSDKDKSAIRILAEGVLPTAEAIA